MKASFFYLILFVVMNLAGSLAQASGALTCGALFTSQAERQAVAEGATLTSIRYPRESIFSEEQRSEIKRLLGSAKASGEQKWNEVATIFLEARLQMIPRAYRAPLFKRLNEFRPRFSAGLSKFDANTFEMRYPEEFRNTAVPYVLAVHEWEHMIRAALRARDPMNFTAGSLNYKFNPAEMYREETQAMAAEWELAQFISGSDAREIVEISQNVFRNRKDLTVVTAIANFASMNRVDYLKATRATNRYSVINVLQKVSKTTAKTALVGSYAGGFVWGGCALFHWVTGLF